MLQDLTQMEESMLQDTMEEMEDKGETLEEREVREATSEDNKGRSS